MKTVLACAALLASLTACTTPSPTHALADPALLTGRGLPCLTDTGSRLAPRGNECAASGRTYTRSDIERTGAIVPSQALQLDPAVTIIYH